MKQKEPIILGATLPQGQILRPFLIPKADHFDTATKSFNFSDIFQRRSGFIRHMKVRLFNTGVQNLSIWWTMVKNTSPIPYGNIMEGQVGNDFIMIGQGGTFNDDYWLDLPFSGSESVLKINLRCDPVDPNCFVSIVLIGYTVDIVPLPVTVGPYQA